MSHDRAFVFDTNALVSALLFEQSVPGRAFVTFLTYTTLPALHRRFRLVLSTNAALAMAAELGRC